MTFKLCTAFILCGLITLSSCSNDRQGSDSIDIYFLQQLEAEKIPGLAACFIKDNKVQWLRAYGLADIENNISMDPSKSIQNIGSISKTITATAIMQLWEQGRLDLDADVNTYLNLNVRNPNFPDTPVTIRQILAHRSSIMDGNAYGKSYKCGDPAVSLEAWIENYFTPGGDYYNAEENFHTWEPGQEGMLPEGPRAYTNVGYGLLGYIVGAITGQTLIEYTNEFIFDPLGMDQTDWLIKDIKKENHVTPYSYIEADFELPEDMDYSDVLAKYPETKTPLVSDTFFPHCLYSFYNYPDGLVRTNADDLSKFLMCYINGGTFNGYKMLEEKTIQSMYTEMYGPENDHGLCWEIVQTPDKRFIGHSGGDPGVNTAMYFQPEDKMGLIILTNSSQGNLLEMMDHFLNEKE